MLARSITSSMSLNLITDMTGPKISSRAIAMSSLTSAKIVGLMKKPLSPNRSPPVTHRGALRLALLDVRQDLVELGLVDLRALLGRGVERVAELAGLDLRGELLDELVVDRLLNEQPAARAAALALVQEQAEQGAVDGRVEIGVGEDDVRALAAQLEGDPLERVGRDLHDDLAGASLAGEGDLVDALDGSPAVRRRSRRSRGRC